MQRYVCIHGHFYQPPRENPWLEAIEVQDSAYPYHDWNERVTAECYAPNTASRILDERERIAAIVNNYSRISFDFGPTLLSWLEPKAPEVYAAVLAAERESRERFSGHGSALAHAYNHMILPLANRRDKRTQVLWGIRDFAHRFGRAPEGMWLPETAVDLETFDVLAELGIRFTVLAPHQAVRERPSGGRWRDVTEGKIDPAMPYRLSLSSGRSIDLFFYDDAISRDVAFGGLLHSGEQFATRLLAGFPEKTTATPRLVHIATDGETYGHHHPHGDMALAFALRAIDSDGNALLTNYGDFLEKHPPSREVEIREYTSWSCGHGVERWRSGCGCSTGAHPGWSQAWRAPLRQALDGLRDSVAAPFEEKALGLFRDPWGARDDYIAVVLDRSLGSVSRFLEAHAVRPLAPPERIGAVKLLELQRHALLMYTSCGWFFDDISGTEAVQVLQYAGRVVQLAEELFGGSFEEGFLAALSQARSNRPEEGDGRQIYETRVRPASIELAKVGGHYAVRSLFASYAPKDRIYCYGVEREDFRLVEEGKMKLALGRARFTSEVTGESADLAFGALHLGDHNVHGGVRRLSAGSEYERLVGDALHAFSRGDLPDVFRRLDAGFGQDIVSLKTLFRDEQRRILRVILESTREEAEQALRQIHERNLPLMRFLADLGSPMPRVFRATAEFVINSGLRRALGAGRLDASGIGLLLEEAARKRVPLDAETLEYMLRKRLQGFARDFSEHPEDLDGLETLSQSIELARRFPFPILLWQVQNVCWKALEQTYPAMRARGESGDAAAQGWVEGFTALAEKLSVRMPGEPAAPESHSSS
jgi:alpha-amylase/alpha-mannosidase (GH57 family)